MHKLRIKLSAIIFTYLIALIIGNSIIAQEVSPENKNNSMNSDKTTQLSDFQKKELESEKIIKTEKFKTKLHYAPNFKTQPISEASKDNYIRVLKLLVSVDISEKEIKKITGEKCQNYPLRSRYKYKIAVINKSTNALIKTISCSEADTTYTPVDKKNGINTLYDLP